MKEKILHLNLYVGLIGLFLSGLLLIFEVPFMKTWFFNFVWWPFILVLDSLNFRWTKSSPLSQSVRRFLFMAYISVGVWLVFELFNLRLRNWSYHSLPPSFFLRWTGYFVAFASVVPAMQELSLFFQHLFRKKNLAFFRIKTKPVILKLYVCLGILFILLSLVWPRIFFPLVWLCFIFIFEPINFWLNNKTVLSDFKRGKGNTFWSWIFAGLTAGILWEFWNFWAGSHWEYSLLYFNFGRIFQMPVLGYLGFLPFAIEVFSIFAFLEFIHKKVQKKHFMKAMIFIFLLVSYCGIFYLIDTFTWIP